MEATTFYNRNFRFVFEPNYLSNETLKLFYNPNKRFLIGAGSLGNYITDKNAETVFKSLENMKSDKKTMKFRKYGKLDIYVK